MNGKYFCMSIAISEEHRALAQSVADFLTNHESRAAARSLLEAEADALPAFWAELGGLGLLGLHVPEELGGSGFGLAETLVVAEEMGRHLAPGPFVPTVITSAATDGPMTWGIEDAMLMMPRSRAALAWSGSTVRDSAELADWYAP